MTGVNRVVSAGHVLCAARLLVRRVIAHQDVIAWEPMSL